MPDKGTRTRAGMPAAGLFVALASLVAAAQEERFLGGPRDGHTRASFIHAPTYATPGQARFSGGLLDSAALGRFQPTAPVTYSLRYIGGARDGGARDRRHAITNPLWHDSDGDGAPDWWELTYYQQVTHAPPGVDGDGDGVDDGGEYAADTSPLNNASVFRITGLTAGATARVTFLCSTNRLYTLERSATLAPAFWQSATPERVQGQPAGIMTFEHGPADSNTFFRVRVDMP